MYKGYRKGIEYSKIHIRRDGQEKYKKEKSHTVYDKERKMINGKWRKDPENLKENDR